MKLKRIRKSNAEEYKESIRIYLESFPRDERRELKQQSRILPIKNYYFYAILDKNKIIGICAFWEFKEFIYGEHIAIRKDLRSKGYGGKIIGKYLTNKKLIAIESEKPTRSKMAKRRLNLYKKLGFIVNKYNYKAKPYDETKKSISYLILTYPRKITKKEFEKIKILINAPIKIKKLS